MDRAARNEIGECSKKQRVTGTPQGGSEAMEVSSGSEHNKYIPNWQVHENNSVFHNKNSDNNIAVELVHGAVLPGDRAHVNSLHPDVVASQLMQGIAQFPALVDRLTQECVQSRRSLKSFEAALEIEKAERERWEHLYKDLYSKMRIQQSEKEEAPVKIPESERKPEALQKDIEVNLQSEKEEAHRKILELEKELDAMQKNIKVLEERLVLMRNLKGEDDMEIRKLNEKVHDLEIKNKKLIVQYRRSNEESPRALMESKIKIDEEGWIPKSKLVKSLLNKDDISFKQKMKEMNKQLELIHELHDARKELLLGMSGISNVNFRVKIMGELDYEIFLNSCMLKFPPEKAEIEAFKLYSFWEDQLTNLKWNPFVITVDDAGNTREFLKKDDELLLKLKQEWGDEIYNAVTTTVKDLIECNPSRRYPVPVFWNSEKDKKATSGEVVNYIFKELESLVRGRS